MNATGTWAEEVGQLRHKWGWFLVVGIFLTIVGTLAISSSLVATLVSIMVFGWLLIIGGGIQFVGAFWAGRWSGFFLLLLSGILNVIVGVLFITRPGLGAVTLTLFLAIFYFVSGLFRIISSLSDQHPNWGWSLFGGLVTFALGVLLWTQWPVSGLWFIGFCVGIDMIFHGLSWMTLGFAARKVPA